MELQILYVDTLFLSNFVMNLLSLSLTGAVLHLPCRRIRALGASFLGGVYAVFAVLFSFSPLLHTLLGLFLSALLIRVCFGKTGRLSLFFRTYALFYFSSVLLGGGIEALFAFLEGLFGARTELSIRPADAVLCIGFLAYLLLSLVLRLLGSGGVPRYVSVRIVYDGKSISLPLLVDSGCLLCDPISGKEAILVSADALRTLLPKEVLSVSARERANIPRDPKFAKRCRLIPMSSVGGSGVLLAFRPDEVTLLPSGGALDVFVAISTGKETRFGGCGGLLPLSLLRGRDSTVASKNGGV